MKGQLTELARLGQLILVGDWRGRTHLVQVVGDGFPTGLLPEPVDLPSTYALRQAVSDVVVPVWRRVQHPAGIRVTVAFADGQWYRHSPPPRRAAALIDLSVERRARGRAA